MWVILKIIYFKIHLKSPSKYSWLKTWKLVVEFIDLSLVSGQCFSKLNLKILCLKTFIQFYCLCIFLITMLHHLTVQILPQNQVIFIFLCLKMDLEFNELPKIWTIFSQFLIQYIRFIRIQKWNCGPETNLGTPALKSWYLPFHAKNRPFW